MAIFTRKSMLWAFSGHWRLSNLRVTGGIYVGRDLQPKPIPKSQAESRKRRTVSRQSLALWSQPGGKAGRNRCGGEISADMDGRGLDDDSADGSG